MQTATRNEALRGFARLAPVIPVVTIEDAARAVPLAETLVRAGLPVVEVTLRTPAALDAIAAIARTVKGAVVAAGTVVTADDARAVSDAGAAFIVTPGTSPRLAEILAAGPLPAMPGCATASEALALAEHGFEMLKFFPAAASGGADWLRSVAAPLARLSFCPTGGINAGNAGTYLSLPNVVCVGGSWMVPPAAVASGDFATIGKLAAEAAGLRKA